MTDSIEARVARGAAWLDENEPGWERKIDLASLDLASSCRCVLGQLWGEFCEWVSRLPDQAMRWLNDDFNDFAHYWPGQCGFNCYEDDDSFEALDEAWIALVKERFASGTLSDGA